MAVPKGKVSKARRNKKTCKLEAKCDQIWLNAHSVTNLKCLIKFVSPADITTARKL